MSRETGSVLVEVNFQRGSEPRRCAAIVFENIAKPRGSVSSIFMMVDESTGPITHTRPDPMFFSALYV